MTSEQEFKKFQREGMLLLVDKTDGIFAAIMAELEDKDVAGLVTKAVDGYRMLLRKVIEENTK
jgi:hypothetical protein